MNVVTPGGVVNLTGSVVTANYFSLLRLQPALGRFFLADEDRVPGRNPVAVLSYDLWRTKFGGAAGVLGTAVRINGTAFTVIGIAPEGFHGIVSGVSPNDVWIPTAMFGVGYRYCDGLARGCTVVNLIGRLNARVSIQEARAEMDILAGQLESTFPDINKGLGVEVRPARGARIELQVQDAPIVALLASAGALVLIIASANVAGLLLARGLRRRKEIAIRLALGASRGRVVRLLLVESVSLALTGGAAGLVVAFWSTGVLRTLFGGGAVNLDLALDPRVMLAGLGIAVVTGVLTGVSPALQATRPDTVGAMKDEAAGAGMRRSRLRDGLIVVQVALSVLAARRQRPPRPELLPPPPRPRLRSRCPGHRQAAAESCRVHQPARVGVSARGDSAARGTAGCHRRQSRDRVAAAPVGPTGSPDAARRRCG